MIEPANGPEDCAATPGLAHAMGPDWNDTHPREIMADGQLDRPNFAVQGDEAANAATCDHLEKFWDPCMRAQIGAGDGSGLEPIAKAAVERLAGASIHEART